ncbi:hypothetical protein ACFQU2_40950 [Siccirubricoccus deserti]
MLMYLLRRLGLALVTCLFISVLTFIIIRLPPGDFVDAYIANLAASGSTVSNEQAEAMRRDYGLDQPALVQYARWLGRVLEGDFGLHGLAPAGDGGDRRPALAHHGSVLRGALPDLGHRPADRDLFRGAAILDR